MQKIEALETWAIEYEQRVPAFCASCAAFRAVRLSNTVLKCYADNNLRHIMCRWNKRQKGDVIKMRESETQEHKLYLFDKIEKFDEEYLRSNTIYLSQERLGKVLSYRFNLDRRLCVTKILT